ncbi:MAG: CbtB-domain containing protein [Planctomycetes bacterium]|nr:CbtB-domain containing protein [Planctomycetota bacterium]
MDDRNLENLLHSLRPVPPGPEVESAVRHAAERACAVRLLRRRSSFHQAQAFLFALGSTAAIYLVFLSPWPLAHQLFHSVRHATGILPCH